MGWMLTLRTHPLRLASACCQAEQLLSRIRAIGATSDGVCGEVVSPLRYTNMRHDGSGVRG
jgi:hypothetical protein